MEPTLQLDCPSALPRDQALVEAATAALRASAEPLTVKQIRALLAPVFRTVALDHLTEVLHRQAAAQVLVLYPKYRSPHERFWDRPLRVHVEHLLKGALRSGPLPCAGLRQRLPDYAKILADSVVEEQLAKGHWHRHPPASGQKGVRVALFPPDPRVYLRPELEKMLERMRGLGFADAELREALFDLVREAEWDSEPATRRSPQKHSMASVEA